MLSFDFQQYRAFDILYALQFSIKFLLIVHVLDTFHYSIIFVIQNYFRYIDIKSRKKVSCNTTTTSVLTNDKIKLLFVVVCIFQSINKFFEQ